MLENNDLRNVQLEELEQIDGKIEKKKKKLKVFLALLVVSVIFLAIVLLTQKGTVRTTEYEKFNFNCEARENMYVEVTGLIPVMEETYESSDNKSYYCMYESEDSSYSNGLIRISNELYSSEKIQAMIKYSEAEFSNEDTLPETVPEPITFYGTTCDIPENFDLQLSINYTVGNIPKVNSGKVYLSGGLEKETTTVMPPIFGIAVILTVIFFILTLIQLVKYSNIKKRKNYLQSVLSICES